MRARQRLLLATVIVMTIAVLFLPRIAQDPAYHHFADQRTVLAIPHFFDVVSNLPFLFVGLWGLVALRRAEFVERNERWPYLVLFVGVTLTCFGSAYYHWAPNNQTLLWDRLPIMVGFMGLLAAMINERINLRLGTGLLAPLLVAGFFSVIYWEQTEMVGHGDLRPYILAQFGSLLVLVLLVTIFPPHYTKGRLIGGAIGFYALAKLLEMTDVPVFRLTRGIVSGHTLKHLAAAAAIVCIVRMLKTRTVARSPETFGRAAG